MLNPWPPVPSLQIPNPKSNINRYHGVRWCRPFTVQSRRRVATSGPGDKSVGARGVLAENPVLHGLKRKRVPPEAALRPPCQPTAPGPVA